MTSDTSPRVRFAYPGDVRAGTRKEATEAASLDTRTRRGVRVVLPGLGAPNGVALLLPLTFTMAPVSAIILLSCMYWGALFGGSITSILFNIPGEPSSVATTFDGYPMAREGRAAEALTAALAAEAGHAENLPDRSVP